MKKLLLILMPFLTACSTAQWPRERPYDELHPGQPPQPAYHDRNQNPCIGSGSWIPGCAPGAVPGR